MTSGVTNVGKTKLLEMAFRNTYDTAAMDTSAAAFYLVLVTSAASFDANTLLFDTATQIDAVGIGMTDGGEAINRDATDWDVLTRDTSSNFGSLQLTDQEWTASATFPRSGSAKFAVLLDKNATIGSRDVLAWFNLTIGRSIGTGATLTLEDIEIKLT